MPSFFSLGLNTDDMEDDGDSISIDQLTIDDELPPLERLVKYSKSDIALQRLVHVKSMADTARQVGFSEALPALNSVMEAVVGDDETDVRLTLAEQIGELAHIFFDTGGEEGYQQVVEMLLTQVGTLLVDDQATVRAAAGSTLVSIAPKLKKDNLESPVLSMVLHLCHDESPDHRALAAQLLNDMAEAFGKQLCTNFGVPELRSLAEDPEFGVRKAAARNMAHICRTVGQELSEEKMLPVFVQLSKDDIWGVRKSCAEALSDMSACMPSSCRTEHLIAMFSRLSADMSRWVRFSAFQQLGPLIATMEPEEVSAEILKQFTNMAHGEGETTLYCAFNFPGVLLTVGGSRWEQLKDSYMLLVKDVQWKVRRSLSHSLHEIAKILGREVTEQDLCEQVFDVFLKDLDEVRVGVLKNFSAFIAILSPATRKNYLDQITHSYLDEDNIGREWRIREILATQVGPLCEIMELVDIQQTVEPVCFKLLIDPVAAVRNSAHKAFGPLLLRYQREDELAGPESNLRDTVIKTVQGFVESPKYLQRQIYVQLCEQLLAGEEKSPGCLKLLEELFLPQCLTLAKDKVANVRLAVARLCSTLLLEPMVSKLKWAPTSKEFATECIVSLASDIDRDVRYYHGKATNTPVPLTPAAARAMNMEYPTIADQSPAAESLFESSPIAVANESAAATTPNEADTTESATALVLDSDIGDAMEDVSSPGTPHPVPASLQEKSGHLHLHRTSTPRPGATRVEMEKLKAEEALAAGIPSSETPDTALETDTAPVPDAPAGSGGDEASVAEPDVAAESVEPSPQPEAAEEEPQPTPQPEPAEVESEPEAPEAAPETVADVDEVASGDSAPQ